LPWSSNHHIDDLIAKRKYDQAIELLEERLQYDPGDFWVRWQFGDALVSKGQKDRAAKVFMGLIEQLASDGKLPKAIAVLKKLKRMEPGQSDAEERLLELWHEEAPGEGTKVLSFRTSAERSPLFSDFSREELLEVVRGLELRSYDSGAILVSEESRRQSVRSDSRYDSAFVNTDGRVESDEWKRASSSARSPSSREGPGRPRSPRRRPVSSSSSIGKRWTTSLKSTRA
jgi:tetratricopeptide (TPR) repeat protein